MSNNNISNLREYSSALGVAEEQLSRDIDQQVRNYGNRSNPNSFKEDTARKLFLDLQDGCSEALDDLVKYLGQYLNTNNELRSKSEEITNDFRELLRDEAFNSLTAGGQRTSEEWDPFAKSLKPELDKAWGAAILSKLNEEHYSAFSSALIVYLHPIIKQELNK